MFAMKKQVRFAANLESGPTFKSGSFLNKNPVKSILRKTATYNLSRTQVDAFPSNANANANLTQPGGYLLPSPVPSSSTLMYNNNAPGVGTPYSSSTASPSPSSFAGFASNRIDQYGRVRPYKSLIEGASPYSSHPNVNVNRSMPIHNPHPVQQTQTQPSHQDSLCYNNNQQFVLTKTACNTPTSLNSNNNNVFYQHQQRPLLPTPLQSSAATPFHPIQYASGTVSPPSMTYSKPIAAPHFQLPQIQHQQQQATSSFRNGNTKSFHLNPSTNINQTHYSSTQPSVFIPQQQQRQVVPAVASSHHTAVAPLHQQSSSSSATSPRSSSGILTSPPVKADVRTQLRWNPCYDLNAEQEQDDEQEVEKYDWSMLIGSFLKQLDQDDDERSVAMHHGINNKQTNAAPAPMMQKGLVY